SSGSAETRWTSRPPLRRFRRCAPEPTPRRPHVDDLSNRRFRRRDPKHRSLPSAATSAAGTPSTRERLIRERKEPAMSAASNPTNVSPMELPGSTWLSSRRGIAVLLLLSLVQFMDVLDASILNIALPSIKHDLGFSQQSLQWIVDGYILTYGGFLLLGARMADLLGRRFVLVTGLVVFATSSLV